MTLQQLQYAVTVASGWDNQKAAERFSHTADNCTGS